MGGLRVDYLRIDVLLPSAYFDEFELRQTVPEPVAVEATGQEVRFTFAAPDPTAPLRVRFVLQADGVGPVRVSARAGSATVDFWQWPWP